MKLQDILDVHKRDLAYHVGLANQQTGITIGKLMEDCPSVSASETSLERTAVWRRLKQLAHDGLIRQVDAGARRTAYYVPSDDLRRAALETLFGSKSGTREKVAYDSSLLDDYIPNETSYLRAGEIQTLHTKCKPGTYLRGERQDRELRRFMSDLSYASSRLEGVDYGHLATKNFFEDDSPIQNMRPRDRKVLMNHFTAAKFLIEGIHFPPREEDVSITEYDLRSLHAIMANGLLRDEMLGTLRTWPVKFDGSCYIPPAVPAEIKRIFGEILRKAGKIAEPYEQAIFLLVHLPYLQPFADCNKRTSRLCSNIPLLRHGILPVSWMDVDKNDMEIGFSAVYEQGEPRLLAEVFVQACCRSFESFSITQTETDPDEIDLRYSNELRLAVRRRVLEGGDIQLPSTVSLTDSMEFMTRVDQIVNACAENPFIGASHGLRLHDIEAFVQRREDETDRVSG
ncbi:MAG: hypothetical protein EPN79_11300 [Burkholderiaceae bacterium]|nr:MAG: hypothetical protein EPN79_11300 [Burkholderiaceae bacterium]TBR76731.1 MAG: hypothetical protein EPN64_05775 [Burkholderiaceae bacterium]